MDTKTIELVEKYLQKEMDEDEVCKFEEELKSNPDLQKEVQLRKSINEAMQQDHIMKFRSELDAIHEEFQKKQAATKIIKLFTQPSYASAIAASVVVILAVAAILFFNNGTSDSSKGIFSNYYQADDAVMMVRSGSSPEDIDLKEALLAYHEKKYNNAIDLLENQKNNVLAKYYLGLSYLETDKLNEAISTFTYIISHKDNLFVEQAEWYLSLCYVKNEEEAKAKVLLDKIVNSNSIYKEKAEKILNKI